MKHPKRKRKNKKVPVKSINVNDILLLNGEMLRIVETKQTMSEVEIKLIHYADYLNRSSIRDVEEKLFR